MSEFNSDYEMLRRKLIDARKAYEKVLAEFKEKYPRAVIPQS